MIEQATYLLNVFFLTVGIILLLERVAPRIGLIDIPFGRKMHERPVPVVGGVAVFIALLSVNLFLEPARYMPPELVAGLALLVVIGVIDDRFGMPPMRKLVGQLAAACIIALPHGMVLTALGNPFDGSSVELGVMALPFTLVFIVGLVNAYNMFDGLDGLAGGASAAAFFWLAATAGVFGRGDLVVDASLLLFGTLGFLVFNLRHAWCPAARVFLGDAGSMMLGAGIAALVIHLAKGSLAKGTGDSVPLVTLLWVCALPAIDTLSLMGRRLLAGRSPLAADRNHLHHLLLETGMSPQQVTELLIALSFLLGGIGFAGAVFRVPHGVMTAGLLIPLVLHIAFVATRRRRPQATHRAVLGDPTVGGNRGL